MVKYATWVVINQNDPFLTNFLANIRMNTTKVNLRDRPPVSLRRVDGQVELRMAARTVEERLLSLQKGASILAVSNAPSADLEWFHEKRFQHLASRFLIVCAACKLERISPLEQTFIQLGYENSRNDPYRNRFLRIYRTESGASPEKPIKTDASPANPNLWLDPVWIDLDETEVENHFSAAPWGATGSFVFPPFRIKETTEVTHYFDSALLARRDDIMGFLGASRDLNQDARKTPLAWTLLRLTDHPSAHDLLQDGGSLDWTCREGMPTELHLHISSFGAPGAVYRSTVILQPESSHKEKWAQKLAAAIGDDLRNLLPDKGLFITARGNEVPVVVWNIDKYAAGRQQEGGHLTGSYQMIEKLQHALPPIDDDPIETVVLLPSALNLEDPDHNKAEILFMQGFWKCPCPGGQNAIAWRQACRRALRHELQRERFESTRKRIEQWNQEFVDVNPVSIT